jgi:hypothetical protein
MAAFVVVLLAGCAQPFDPRPEDPGPMGRVEGLLLHDAAPRLVIRSYFVEGRDPVPSAMDWLAGRLKQATGKPEVTVAAPQQVDFGVPSEKRNWTAEQARGAFASLTIPREAGSVNLVVLFFDGYGYSYGRARGFQDGQFLAIFPDTFRTIVGVGDPVDLEVPDPAYDGEADQVVLLHEAGHMLGLVNNGLEMVHDHVDRTEECLCHSSNEASVMFTGNHDIADLLMRGLEPYDSFDEDDLADIRAFQASHR